ETFLLLGSIGGNLASYMPSYRATYNDSMLYWREAYTFSQVGFNGGFYTTNELPARLGFIHFYVYGPVYPIVYGTIGRLFGWYYATPVIINLALIGLAIAAFTIITRPDRRQLLLAGALFATFWPILLFLLSNMQESYQQALAILLGGGFALLFS